MAKQTTGNSKGASEKGAGAKVRLDKWLWAARFFKTRAIAKQAVEGVKFIMKVSALSAAGLSKWALSW